MSIDVIKWIRWIEDSDDTSKVRGRTIVVAAAVPNPYAGQDVDSLGLLINPSNDLGTRFGEEILRLLEGRESISYGKGALVGRNGEFEHGKALLTNRFVNPIRIALGNADSWVPSTCKKSSPGEVLDIPLGNLSDLWSEKGTHTISINFPGVPRTSEILVAFAVYAK